MPNCVSIDEAYEKKQMSKHIRFDLIVTMVFRLVKERFDEPHSMCMHLPVNVTHTLQ